MTRIGVVTFPAARAVEIAGAQAVSLWHKDADLHGVDAVVIPGGFSYGDYLRCGAIAATAPVMSEIVREAGRGLPVLGICNGFQVLCESHLLPGALIRNDHQKFLCRDQVLRIENADTAWTRAYSVGDTITVPLKNGEGNFQAYPEHATEAGFGPLSLGPDGASHHGGTDGLGIFRSVLASLVG